MTRADEECQRQTIVGNFYQLDRLVVEGSKSVCWPFDTPMWPFSHHIRNQGTAKGKKGNVVRQEDTE